jgi:hypothetical protein
MRPALAQLEQAESQAKSGGCACVHAMVVPAAPAVLPELAGRGGVGVVDPVPAVTGAVPPTDTGVPPS